MSSIPSDEENIYICRAIIVFIKDKLERFLEQLDSLGSDVEIVQLTFKELEALKAIYFKYLKRTSRQFKTSTLVLEFRHYYLPQIKMPEPPANVIYLEDRRK